MCLAGGPSPSGHPLSRWLLNRLGSDREFKGLRGAMHVQDARIQLFKAFGLIEEQVS